MTPPFTQTAPSPEEVEAAAAHWDLYADEVTVRGEWEVKVGLSRSTETASALARSCRQAAESLRARGRAVRETV